MRGRTITWIVVGLVVATAVILSAPRWIRPTGLTTEGQRHLPTTIVDDPLKDLIFGGTIAGAFAADSQGVRCEPAHADQPARLTVSGAVNLIPFYVYVTVRRPATFTDAQFVRSTLLPPGGIPSAPMYAASYSADDPLTHIDFNSDLVSGSAPGTLTGLHVRGRLTCTTASPGG